MSCDAFSLNFKQMNSKIERLVCKNFFSRKEVVNPEQTKLGWIKRVGAH